MPPSLNSNYSSPLSVYPKIQPKVQAEEDPVDEEEISVTIAADYNLSGLNFSAKHKETQSALTWSDMYLQGGRLAGEISVNADTLNRIYVDAGFAASFDGSWTDDDSRNYHKLVTLTDSKVTAFNLGVALGKADAALVRKIGFEYSSLAFTNYNAQFFYKGEYSHQDIPGLVTFYNQEMYRLYGSAQARLVAASVFYADFGGQIGLTLGLGDGNWLLRSDLQHPESFKSAGLFLRAGGSLEAGLKIKRFTLFTSIQGDYEISPWLSQVKTLFTDGEIYKQASYQELSGVSWGIGVKGSF